MNTFFFSGMSIDSNKVHLQQTRKLFVCYLTVVKEKNKIQAGRKLASPIGFNFSYFHTQHIQSIRRPMQHPLNPYCSNP